MDHVVGCRLHLLVYSLAGRHLASRGSSEEPVTTNIVVPLMRASYGASLVYYIRSGKCLSSNVGHHRYILGNASSVGDDALNAWP